MITYLEKFNSLPKELRDKISSHEVMIIIGELERKYAISLASVVMRVMIKELNIDTLADYFIHDFSFEKSQAADLTKALKEKVFIRAGEYLGIIKNRIELPVPLDEVPSYFGPQQKGQEEKKLDNWMGARKADMSPRGSSFFFSTEDEEEVKELAKKVAGFGAVEQKKLDAEEGLKAVIKEAGINFSSGDMEKRFSQVVKTYLHGIRNRVDTKQTLIKSVEVGGLGIDNSQADKILQIANKYRREPDQPTLQAPAKIKTPEEIATEKADYSAGNIAAKAVTGASGDVAYDFEALIKGDDQTEEGRKKQAELEAKKKHIEKGEQKEIGPLKREKSTYKDEENDEEGEEKDEFIDLTKLENLKDDRTVDIGKQMRAQSMLRGGEESNINIIQARAAANADGKIKMEDVKYIPKLTGPIDELREMNVLNFRRLSENPREAVLKIKKKISFLEEESYTKRFEGIKAWRQSPVNRLYLEIGQESIINKSPVSDIIEKRRQSRKPSLMIEEFKAVMDLNKDLRF